MKPRKEWTWVLLLGIALIVLGAFGLGSRAVLTLTATLILGPLLMVSGLLQVLLAFFTGSWRGSSLHLMAAALDLAVGLLVLLHPAEADADLVLVLLAYLMAGGLYRVLGSLFLRFPAWGCAVAAGLAPLLLGILLWQYSPFRELWLVALCVAADFMGHGTSWVVVSQAVRRSQQAEPETVSPLPEAEHEASPPPAEEGGKDWKQILAEAEEHLARDTEAIDQLDALIRKAEEKRRAAGGTPS
jgi:uncharacterized membrane protein HdeD (DUF308 family)